jgi:methyltransferase (TIGR00027 family)
MVIETISDTSRWMAYVRAMESKRSDALFRDRFALHLAGEAGEAIARDVGDVEFIAQSIAVRTAVLDEMILDTLNARAADLVLNLGAGLDARPWRLELPRGLRWVDVDFPHVLEFKASVIAREPANCEYESLAANILEPAARDRALQHCSAAKRVLVVSEGLLVYLSPAQVSGIARALHAQAPIEWWLTDLIGPRALRMLQQVWGARFAGAEFRFGPDDSVEFFQRLGWREASFRSTQVESERLHRSPPTSLLARMMLWLASDSFREELRRLSGVALLSRERAAQAPV